MKDGFLADALATKERQVMKDELNEYSGNRAKVAKSLGIHRNTLLRKMTKYGLLGMFYRGQGTWRVTRKKGTR